MNDIDRSKLLEDMTISALKSMEPYELLGAEPVDYLAAVMRMFIMMLTSDCLDRLTLVEHQFYDEPVELHIDETLGMMKECILSNLVKKQQALSERPEQNIIFGDTVSKRVH